jgi:hypothetical protein
MDDEQAARLLREDETRCVRILAACRRLAVNAGGAAGNYATFAQNEEVLLRSFKRVVDAHASYDGHYDALLTQRWQKAGLTPTDMRVLQEHLTRLQQSEEEDDDDVF